MLENQKWTSRVVGVTTGATLAIALAVVAGAIPQQGQPSGLPAASAAPLDATAPDVDAAEGAARAEVTADALDVASAVPSPEAHAAELAAPEAEESAAVGSLDPVEQAPAAAPPAPPASSPSAAPAAAPTAPAAPMAPTPVARRQPSPAEVQQALDGLERYVDSPFAPSPAQVAEAGDKVCTAFDEGQTFTQVKATARELVAKVPLTTVHPGADDYVVRTMVALYCPGHAPKLA